MEWTVGSARVSMVRESSAGQAFTFLFPEGDRRMLDENASWLKPHFLYDNDEVVISIHSLVIESQGQVILVDSCIGCRPSSYRDTTNTDSPYLENLGEAGYTVEDIDIVVCTHLHFDHVGWNTRLVDGKWVPTFPNARYLFSRVDFEFWDDHPTEWVSTFDDTVRPVVEAGQADLVAMDHRVNSEVWFEPSPGHSPGHVCVHISSQGKEAVITGDIVHHPLQFFVPRAALAH